MKISHLWRPALALLPLFALTALAQSIVLTPGGTRTVQFDSFRIIEKGGPPAVLRDVTAQVSFALAGDAKTLTIKVKNTSTNPAAALYALDLGLPTRHALTVRAEASYADFPANSEWLGPTDYPDITGGTGIFSFAARPAVLQRMSDFLDATQPLPPGFLIAGQQGTITTQLRFEEEGARVMPLRLTPMTYWLVSDTRTQARRAQLIARLNGNTQP